MSNSVAATPYRIGLLCLAVTATGWGLNWPAMKVLLRELPPLFARGFAGTIAALVFVVIALSLGQSLRVPKGVAGRLVAAAAVNVFVWMGFATLAMRWLDVGQCALLVYTMPIWAMLLAWPLRGQRPSARAVGGLVLCFAGLGVLFGGGALHLDAHRAMGAALALLAAVMFAYGTVALKPLSEMPPMAVLAWQLGLGCFPMLLIGCAFESPALVEVSPAGWWLMGYMTVLPMGICYLTWFAALRRLAPAMASIATLVTPVVGILSASFFLGERLGTREIAALLLTLGGVALALRPAGDPEPPDVPDH